MINTVKTTLSIVLLLLIPVFVLGAPPPGVDITLDSLLDTAKSIAGFLMVAGGILAGITIVATGIMYLMAGGNTQRMAGAKSMFKAGIIGALIIFSPGVIISTVTGFGSNPLGFFGGSGGNPASVDTWSCSANNACVLASGGIFADSNCADQCGPGGQSLDGACYDCTNQGSVWCLAIAACISNELNCPGVFTKVPGGCP